MLACWGDVLFISNLVDEHGMSYPPRRELTSSRGDEFSFLSFETVHRNDVLI